MLPIICLDKVHFLKNTRILKFLYDIQQCFS